ncbi:MAG TPA: hypothetical protein VGL56_08610 [Fimbriimonadaceae bacterium]
MKPKLVRISVETAFIVLLFYSNLLMGEYTRFGMGNRFGLVWAIRDIFTPTNFVIAVVAALLAHILFDLLRKRL